MTKRILILGGGFAGLWSAVGAARRLAELGVGPDAVRVTLINRDAFHSIRVRNYERDLAPARVPLDDVLGPIGVDRVQGDVTDIDSTTRAVTVTTPKGRRAFPYDRLVCALGSQLVRPAIPGLVAHAFDVDTYDGAERLAAHLRSLPEHLGSPGQSTVVVVGAGLTGIETACEMPGRLKTILGTSRAAESIRVVLADREPVVGSDMGASARPVIEEALASLGIETRLGTQVSSVEPGRILFASGEAIAADTVVWCAGMRANPLARLLRENLDRLGRVPVADDLRIDGGEFVFVAGDAARARMDDDHVSVMSCQHSRPMGRFAGYNAASDLLGLPTLPLRIDWYTTILDLGPWGAVYTEGWDRHVVAKGEPAKRTKQIINGKRIYPPLTRDRREIFAAAAPTVQSPPALFH